MTLDRDQVARALPGYDIGEEIGRGGWGVVLRADHRQLGRPVAVKELPRAFAADPGVRRRFVSEARLLATLDHPHIVPIYDFVEEEGLCLLVMELLPGGTLWDRFTTVGVSHDSACSIVVAACSALNYAHGKGILHRDIKPENLLFAASGTLKVSDFGIAKVVGGTASMATRTGEVLGTPAYMAPEQALGAELTPATDVYALGTVLYELLSGRLPFVDDGNAIALLYRHVHEQPTPLAEAAPGLPPELVETTMKALAADPNDRFETAEDFGVALADAAAEALGPDWLQRGGIAVMATGRIGARISGPHHLDTEPRPATPRIGTDGGPAPETIIESTPVTAASTHGAELSSISPDQLVPVQDVVADAPAADASAADASAPEAPVTDAPAVVPAPATVPPEAVAPGPPTGPAPAAPTTSPPAERRARRSKARLVGVLVVLGALVAGGIFVFGRSGSKQPSATPPTTLPTTPGSAPTVAATIALQPKADHVVFAFDAIFVTESTSKALARIDPATNRVTQIASLPHTPHAIDATSDALWITGSDAPVIMRVVPGADPAHTKTTTFPIATTAAEIAVGDGAVWVTAPKTNALLRIDPTTNQVVATIAVGSAPDALVVDADGVWVANRLSAGTVTQVDPTTNKVVATIPVGKSPDQVTSGAGSVWAVNPGDGTVSRIDAKTARVAASISVGGQPKSVLFGAGAIWVSMTSGAQVLRIDPTTNTVTDTLTVGANPEHGAVGAGGIWIVSHGDDTVARITAGA